MGPLEEVQQKCIEGIGKSGKPLLQETKDGVSYCRFMDIYLANKVAGMNFRGACGYMNICRDAVTWDSEDKHRGTRRPECLYGRHLIGDWHTHTSLSDGRDPPEMSVEHAAAIGLDEIAITDHLFSRKFGGTSPSIADRQIEGERCTPIRDYTRAVRSLGEIYWEKLRVLAGVEVDARPELNPYIHELNTNDLNMLDLVLFEHVGMNPNPKNPKGISLQEFIRIRKSIKRPVGLAHTDMNAAFPEIEPDELARILAENDIFVEINGIHSSIEGHEEAMVKHGVKFTAGSDAHSARGVGDFLTGSRIIMKNLGLEQMRL